MTSFINFKHSSFETFHHFCDSFSVIKNIERKRKFDKSIYLVVEISDLSKLRPYELLYNIVQTYYEEKT